MADTSEILAQTRLALRRDSPSWSHGTADELGARPVDPSETAPYLNRAAQLQDVTGIHGRQRLRLAKKMVLRFMAFWTERLTWFHETVVHVLKGHSRSIDALVPPALAQPPAPSPVQPSAPAPAPPSEDDAGQSRIQMHEHVVDRGAVVALGHQTTFLAASSA